MTAPVSPIATQEQEVGLAIYDQWAHSDQKSHTLARLIAEAIRAALSSAERRAEAFIAGGAMPPPRSAPVRPDQSRDALTQVVFAAWGALDNAEETASGYVLDRGDVDKLADAMDALSALVPDSEQPFGGGFPARYLWDRALSSAERRIEELGRDHDGLLERALAIEAERNIAQDENATLKAEVEELKRERDEARETGRWLAAALIAAEIDRLDRLAPTGRETSGEET